jgi:hypothetical protein
MYQCALVRSRFSASIFIRKFLRHLSPDPIFIRVSGVAFCKKIPKFIRADLRRLIKNSQNLSKHVMRDLGVLSGVLALFRVKAGMRRPPEAPEGWCPEIWVFEAQKSPNLCPEIWVFEGNLADLCPKIWVFEGRFLPSWENLGKTARIIHLLQIIHKAIMKVVCPNLCI